MALRPSNRQRNHWAVSLLNVEPTDRFLEVGFGPGIAIREAARRATRGKVTGVDHSDEMVRQATRRNRDAVQKGRVELHQMDADALRALESTFEKVLVVNSLGFWPQPVDRLADLHSIMSDWGVIAIVSQPRCPGATNEHTERAEQEIRQQLQQAGFSHLRSERLELDPTRRLRARHQPDRAESSSQRILTVEAHNRLDRGDPASGQHPLGDLARRGEPGPDRLARPLLVEDGPGLRRARRKSDDARRPRQGE
jgi:SAM-dependent methyltransferase